jgi:hypothetical protein
MMDSPERLTTWLNESRFDSGDIVLLHDNRSVAAPVLGTLCALIRDAGMSPEALPDNMTFE